jgi:hypothetical protein
MESSPTIKSKSIFALELKRSLCKRNIIAIVVFAIVLQFFLQVGRHKYIDVIDSSNSLQEIERAKVSQYSLYRQYGGYGITLMFISSNFSVLYNDPIFERLLSNVNTSSTLNIYKPFKGSNYFIDKSGGYLNFAGIFLLFGVFFALIYGRETTSKLEYSIFLSSILPPKKFLRAIVFSRLLIINLAFVLVAIVSVLPLLIYKINLFRRHFAVIILGIILMISFSFALGCFIGAVRRKRTYKRKKGFNRAAVTLVIYLIAVALIPLSVNFFIQITASDIAPLFDFDFDNLKTIVSIEKNLIEKYGVLKRGETPEPEEAEDVWKAFNNEFKKILENEERLKKQVFKKIEKKQFISSLFPVLFYLSIFEEVSSHGGGNFIEFHTFSKTRKEQFIEFCFKKIYSGQNNPPVNKIESFIKDNEDLFIAKSRLPEYLWLGVVISLLYTVVFFFISFRMFLNRVIKGDPGEIRNFSFNIYRFKFKYLVTADQGLKNQIYNFFSGSGFTSVDIKIEGEDLKQKGCIWLCNPQYIDDELDGNALYKALYGEKLVEGIKTWEIMFRYAIEKSEGRIIVLDNFFKGLKGKEVEEILRVIRKEDIISLYIGDNYYEAEKLGDDELIYSLDDTSIDAIAEIAEVVKKRK